MKINTQQELKNIRGDILRVNEEACPYCKRTDPRAGEAMTVGLALSNIVLAPHKTKNGFRPLRAYELAKKFANNKSVELEKSEYTQIKELIEDVEGVTVPLVKGQLLEIMINEKE